MTVAQAARLILTYVIQGRTPTRAQLPELTQAMKVLRQANVDPLDAAALRRLIDRR
jgi:hypothetical protein